MENPESKKTKVKRTTKKTTVTKTTEVKVKAERKPRAKKAPKAEVKPEVKVEAPVIKPVDEHVDGFSAKLTVAVLLIMMVALIVYSIAKKDTPKPATVEPQANMILQDTVAKDTMVTVLDTGKVDTIVTASK